MESVWNDVGSLSIHGRVSKRSFAADRIPIVFVHGLGVSMRYMEPTMALLAQEHPVAGLDMPGFGRSATPRRAFSVRELADALEQWLDIRNLGPALFVGNSFGCQVIVECATRSPARAVGLVLNAPTMDPAHRTVFGQFVRVIADIPREPVLLAMHVALDYLRVGPFRLTATLRTALADRIEEKLPHLAVPTLVVCGARDPVVTAEWGDQVARLVGSQRDGASGGTLRVIPGAAHALPYDDPETFAESILSVYARV